MDCKKMMVVMMGIMMIGVVVGQGGTGTSAPFNPLPFTTCYTRCMFFCMIQPQNVCACASTCLKQCLDKPPATTTATTTMASVEDDQHAQNLGYCKLGCATSLCSNIAQPNNLVSEGESMGRCVDSCSNKCNMSFN